MLGLHEHYNVQERACQLVVISCQNLLDLFYDTSIH